MKKQSGFTIVELLVVIVVIGILAAITIASYTGITQKATVASLKSDLSNASQQLKIYQVTNSAYPGSITDCPSPAASNMCLKSSSGTTYTQYAVNDGTSTQGFCITATKSSTNYKITNDNAPVQGDCQSYGLTMKLDAGDVASYPSPFNGTTWTDLSGNGYNGTLNNGVGYNAMNNGTLSFDGVDDYVSLPLISSSIYPITLAVWFRSPLLNQFRAGIISVGNTTTGYRLTWGTEPANNNLYMLFPNICWINTNYPLSVNTWYNVTGTIERETSTTVRVKIYVNGILVHNNEHANPFTPVTASAIGRELQVPGYFNGLISESRIYSRVQSAAEVLQNFNLAKSRYGL